MQVEIINSYEKLVINSTNTSRYLGYPRKVPLWKVEFLLPRQCELRRDNSNSDISLEIENGKGTTYVPSLSAKESIFRTKQLIPNLLEITKSERV